MKTLVLLDTHALIHRAYHALPPFTSKKTGEPTGALYGLSAMLIKVIRDLKPDYLVAAYDLPDQTFRHKEYKDYKATRKEIDENLIKQLIRAHDVLEAFGIEGYSAPGFEADDVLGTIVKQTSLLPEWQEKFRIIIVSGDMDILQLAVGDRVVVYTMRKGLEDTVIYDEDKVHERFGFPPLALPDYKGLRGDASDNIKGVPGIGEKTATDILKNFGNIENLYKEIEEDGLARRSLGEGGAVSILKPRIIQLLKDHKTDAFFSKTLATIRRDAPVDFKLPIGDYRLKKESITPLFEELGFNSLLTRIQE